MRRDSPDPKSASSASSKSPTPTQTEAQKEAERRAFERMRRVKTWPIKHEPPRTEPGEG